MSIRNSMDTIEFWTAPGYTFVKKENLKRIITIKIESILP